MTDLSQLSDQELLALRVRAGQMPGVGEDMAKSFGVGAGEGVIGIAGLPGDAAALAKAGLQKAGVMAPDTPPSMTPNQNGKLRENEPLIKIPGSREIKQAIENNITGPFYEPKTIPGEYSRTIGETLPAAAFGTGGLVRRGLANVVLPALASETMGQATKGQPNEGYARVVGGVLGAMGPTGAARAITPLPASAERNRMVQILRDEGVDSLTAGQVTGSRPLQWIEQAASDMPFAGQGARRITDQGREEFTSAALRRVGENANRADDVTMDRAFTRIGQQYDDLAARNNVQADRQLATDIGAVQQDYHFLANPMQRQVLDGAVNDIIGVIQQGNGTLSGAQYQAMRSRLDRARRSVEGTDQQLSQAFGGLRTALDDAMGRSIPPGSPDAALWAETNRQYRNILPLERAATGAGAETAEGIISPRQLRTAVVGQNRRAYARGEGDYGELARAGTNVMNDLPNSGTPARTMAQALLQGGVEAGTMGLPIVAGRALMSRPVQAYLGNQALSPVLQNTTARRDALAQLLLSEPRLQLQTPSQQRAQ